DRQPADAPVERAVEELLIEREDRQMPGLSTPVHFLDELIVADAGLGAEIIAVAVGDDDLERRVPPPYARIAIERPPERRLIRVLRQVFRAAAEVVRSFTDVAEIDCQAGV